MNIDPSSQIQVSRTPEGGVTVNIPPNAVDWKALMRAVLPVFIQVAEQSLGGTDATGGQSGAADGTVLTSDQPQASAT